MTAALKHEDDSWSLRLDVPTLDDDDDGGLNDNDEDNDGLDNGGNVVVIVQEGTWENSGGAPARRYVVPSVFQ